jgi:hypothetical protein
MSPLAMALVVIWAATAVGALAGAAGLARATGEPSDALPATAGTAAELVAHNATVALWPIALVAVGWPWLRGVRCVGDALVATQLAGHGLVVGTALGARFDLWRFLPHLPLEWLGLAIPAAAWIRARTTSEGRHAWLMSAAACLGVLVAAAAVETYLVPVA